MLILDFLFREMRLMTYANSKRRDLISRATFFCLVKLPVYAVLPDPLSFSLYKIRGLARETKLHVRVAIETINSYTLCMPCIKFNKRDYCQKHQCRRHPGYSSCYT